MVIYIAIIALACVLACIGVILGKQAASVFAANERVTKAIAVLTGVSGVVVWICFAYIFGWLPR